MGLIRPYGLFGNHDFFLNYSINNIKLKGRPNIYKKYKLRKKKDIAKKIFSAALKMALEDVLNGDVEIKMINTDDIYLRMTPKEGQALIDSITRDRRNWSGVDLVKSGFKVWYPCFDFGNNKYYRRYQICVQERYKQIVESKINNGFRYS